MLEEKRNEYKAGVENLVFLPMIDRGRGFKSR
jgi:hypothetical protein